MHLDGEDSVLKGSQGIVWTRRTIGGLLDDEHDDYEIPDGWQLRINQRRSDYLAILMSTNLLFGPFSCALIAHEIFAQFVHQPSAQLFVHLLGQHCISSTIHNLQGVLHMKTVRLIKRGIC